MQSKATNVADYLAGLPADRRTAISKVRDVILNNLDSDYEEGMQYGMIGYYVPHAIFPDGYHCDPKQPLPFMGLASQKNHMAIYMMCLYDGKSETDRFRREWEQRGKKLDMGKCCIRFRKVEDLCLDLIGETIKRVPAVKYVAAYQQIRAEQNARPVKGKPGKVANEKSKPAAATKKFAKKKAVAKKVLSKKSVPAKAAKNSKPAKKK